MILTPFPAGEILAVNTFTLAVFYLDGDCFLRASIGQERRRKNDCKQAHKQLSFHISTSCYLKLLLSRLGRLLC
jgi:hypothetical protein